MTMIIIVFWNVTLCSLVVVYGHFGGICCVYLKNVDIA
jgi:hypothetical protein